MVNKVKHMVTGWKIFEAHEGEAGSCWVTRRWYGVACEACGEWGEERAGLYEDGAKMVLGPMQMRRGLKRRETV